MQLVSVERVMEYSKLDSEGELETVPKDKTPSAEWPDKGIIMLNEMKFKYSVDHPYVLKSLSFNVESCEKVHHSFSYLCVFTAYL